MRSSVDLDELGAGRYELDGSLKFINGTEHIPGATDEK
jgi:hypothetical protein